MFVNCPAKRPPFQYNESKDKNDLLKLKKFMPPRYRTTLANKYHVCEKYIDYIFRGERNRPDIIDEAIKMANEYQDYLKIQSEKIRTIINIE